MKVFSQIKTLERIQILSGGRKCRVQKSTKRGKDKDRTGGKQEIEQAMAIVRSKTTNNAHRMKLLLHKKRQNDRNLNTDTNSEQVQTLRNTRGARADGNVSSGAHLTESPKGSFQC